MGHGDSMSALRISAVTVTPVAFADPSRAAPRHFGDR